MRVNTSSLIRAGQHNLKGSFNTGQISRKLASVAAYHAEMMNALNDGRAKTRIIKAAARTGAEFFSQSLDSKARSNSSRFHHVYEWGEVGNPSQRLFKYNITGTNTAVINFQLTESMKPNKDGYVFSNKATVMETGQQVTIAPVNAEKLVFEYNGETIFTPKTIVVDNPGGDAVVGSFTEEFNSFMQRHFLTSLGRVGFFDRITKGIESQSRLIIPRISKTTVSSAINQGRRSADVIASNTEVVR